MKLNEWIINGDVGVSSKTMWSVLQGIEYAGDKPYDPDDFSRCYKFVKECNITKQELKNISKTLPYWKPYIDNWDKLTEMYEQNVNENWVNYKQIGMFEFMKELRVESDLILNSAICPFGCGVKTELIIRHEKFELKGKLKDNMFYQYFCPSCKERFSTTELDNENLKNL